MPSLTLQSLKFAVLQMVCRYFTWDICVIRVILKQNDEKTIYKDSETQNLV